MCVAYPSELKSDRNPCRGVGRGNSNIVFRVLTMRGEHVVAALVPHIRRDNACNEDSYA